MPRQCTICNHEQIEDINKAVIGGDSLRKISQDFGISYDALYRHNKHLPAEMTKAKEAAEVTQADTLLEQVQSLQSKAISLLEQAESAGDMRTALQGVREARGCIELLAKLQGELEQQGTVNITLAPEWLEMRTVILQAVEGYPDARQSIVKALGGGDDD